MVAIKNIEDSLQYTITSCTKSTVHLKCLWTISKFMQIRNDVKKKGEWLDSTETLTFFSGTFSFRLSLYPRGLQKHASTSIAVYVAKTSASKNLKPWISFRFALKDCDGNLHHDSFIAPYRMENQTAGTANFIPCPGFPPSDQIETFLPNGCLQIYAEGTFWKESRDLGDAQIPWGAINTSSASLDNLLREGYESDVTLVVGDKEFKAHKNIITCRIAYFKNMFKDSTSEKWLITGVQPDVFQEVLHFMYTDTATASMKSMLADMLKFSNTIGFGLLKNFCVSEMIDRISADNIITYFRASNDVKADELRNKCMDFMIKNKEIITKRSAWKLFKEEHKDLVDLLEEMMRSGNPIANF